MILQTIMTIYDKLYDTHEFEILQGLEKIYCNIQKRQSEWKESCGITCPDGCGSCCVNFEPDVLESEALYLAAWMLENQKDRAYEIMTDKFVPARSDPNAGCFLFNETSPYHCSVYGGRCLICRFFGFSGDRAKDSTVRWKPCHFLPEKNLLSLKHKQYSEEELKSLFNALPPTMCDFMEQALNLTPGHTGDTKPLRIALKEALIKIVFLTSFNDNGNDNNSPNDEPLSA